MTKKKTPSTESKAKKAPVASKKPAAVAKKKPTASAKTKAGAVKTKTTEVKGKAASAKARPAKTPKTKAKAVMSKSANAEKPMPKRQPRRRSKVSEEGESKVREIATQTKPEPSEDKGKGAERGFSLSDVRSILSNRSKDEQATGSNADPPSKEKARSGKGSKTSKVKTSKVKASKVKKIQTASIDDILGLNVSAVSPRPIRDEKKVPKLLISYYNDLMELRASLKGALGERSHETLGASARESSGELSLNSSDAGTETFNRDVALSMVASEQEALEEIEDAIDRIFDGTFGVCQETGKPIKKTRLKVVPFTRFSLEGQNLFEQRKRREGDPVTGAFATISDSTMGQED